MKKLVFISLFIIFSISLFSQNFLSENKQWNVKLDNFGSITSTEIFFIDGDSVVNNLNYKKIWFSSDSLENSRFEGLLREVDNKVYFIPKFGEEGLLYDFNLNVGDTASIISLPSDGEFDIFITAIDSVEYDGVIRKRMHIDSEYITFDEYWIEGIGDCWGPLYTLIHSFIICPFWELACVHDNGELIYMNPNTSNCYEINVGIDEVPDSRKTSISPNPVSKDESFIIDSENHIRNIKIYNIDGRLVKTLSPSSSQSVKVSTRNLKKGMYLIQIELKDKKIHSTKLIIQ